MKGILHVIRISLVFHSYLNVCHSYVTQISYVCHYYVNSMYLHVIHYVVPSHWHAIRMSFLYDLYVIIRIPLILYHLCYSYTTRIFFVCHSYVSACHSYVTSIYSSVIRMSLVGTRMPLVYHFYVLVYHLYVTRMSTSLLCTRMSFVRVFTMNR